MVEEVITVIEDQHGNVHLWGAVGREEWAEDLLARALQALRLKRGVPN